MNIKSSNVVYIVGAGLSAGLGFPTIHNLLPGLWERLHTKDADDLARVIRFHHPDFNASRINSYPTIEHFLSEIKANEDLFQSTRSAVGGFTADELLQRRSILLYELSEWFHELKAKALRVRPDWLIHLTAAMKDERASVISFNWDLVLDELLFGDDLSKSSYGLDRRRAGVRLIKPHGSLNWYKGDISGSLKKARKFPLAGVGDSAVFAFRPLRAPRSSQGRRYMPLIVPPVYSKQFEGPLFRKLWQESVSVLSNATEVRFIGFSLAEADFHARFVLRCGFYNQEQGYLKENGRRSTPAGRAEVTIVDPSDEPHERIRKLVGWECVSQKKKVSEWIADGGLQVMRG